MGKFACCFLSAFWVVFFVVVVPFWGGAGVAFEFKPDIFGEGCPKYVRPADNFDEDKLIGVWTATHLTMLSLKPFKCLKNDISRTETGLRYHVTLVNATGYEYLIDFEQTKTATPGVYNLTYKVPNRGTVYPGRDVVLLQGDDYVVIWRCVDVTDKDGNSQAVFVASKSGLPVAESVVDQVKSELPSNGSRFDFYRAEKCITDDDDQYDK